LPTTLVELELSLGGQSVNLQKIVSVIRRDPGFAAEVIRLARSYEDQRPLPLETCLIHLGTRTLRRATRIVPVWIQPLSDSELWKLRWRLRRTRLVALAAELISGVLGDISGDTAYLAGLLHELPALVCLSEGCSCSVGEIVPEQETWNLPDYLVQTMRWHRQPTHAAPEHFPVVRRVAAARAWVDEVLASPVGLPADLDARISRSLLWQHMPNRLEVLSLLAGRIDEWRYAG
jgi:HD-like signal output (HDOD) protein